MNANTGKVYSMDVLDFIEKFLTDYKRHLFRERLLEGLGIFGVSILVLFSIAVGVTTIIEETEVLRWVLILLGVLIFIGLFIDALIYLHHELKDDVSIAFNLSSRVSGLTKGFPTVISKIRSPEKDDRFSKALLTLEAMRATVVLSKVSPQDIISHRKVIFLVIILAFLVGMMVIFSAVFPRQVARGVRELIGISGLSPIWMKIPPLEVDNLGYDIQVSFRHPSFHSVIGEGYKAESDTIIAPSGIKIVISGRLTSQLKSGNVVFISIDGQKRFPLSLSEEGGFSSVLETERAGEWFIEGMTKYDIPILETTRRKIIVSPPTPPRIWIHPPYIIGVNPNDTITIPFYAESSLGLVGVDAIYSFPEDPDRYSFRIHITDFAVGTKKAEGHVNFTMPKDVPGGRVDLTLQAIGLLVKDVQEGKSNTIRLYIPTTKTKAFVMIEAGLDFYKKLLIFLADILESQLETLTPEEINRLKEIVEEAVSLTREGGDEQNMKEVANKFETIKVYSERKEVIQTLENILFKFADVVSQDFRLLFMWRLKDIALEYNKIARNKNLSFEEFRESVTSLVKHLRLLKAEAENPFSLPFPGEGLTKEVTTISKAIDILNSILDTSHIKEETITKVMSITQEVLQAWSDSPYLATDLGNLITIGAGLIPLIRVIVEKQRQVMERTGELAFRIKQIQDTFAKEHTPDIQGMIGILENAMGLLKVISAHVLDPYNAEEMAKLREDLNALKEVLSSKDLEAGVTIARTAYERCFSILADLRYGYDPEDEKESLEIKRISNRVAKVLDYLRGIKRELDEWKKNKDGVVGPQEKAEAREIRKDQNGVLAMCSKMFSLLVETTKGKAEEAIGIANSAKRNMEEASKKLSEGVPHSAEAYQRQAVQELLKLKRFLETGMDLSLTKEEYKSQERVTLEKNTVKPIDKLITEIAKYRKEPCMPGYYQIVQAYYDSLLKF